MKRISVIIPIYNAENSIERCLDSIIPQLSNQDEIILLNDGSKDQSIKILREYEKEYPFIRVIDKKNEGAAITRNRGIKEAMGKYICFIDNDDYVELDYFDTYYQTMKKTDADLVMGGYRRVSEDGVKFSVKPVQSFWYQLMVVAPWAKMYRRQFLNDENIEFLNCEIGEDNYFNFLVYTKTKKVKIIDYVGYNWWYNEESISNTSQRGFRDSSSASALLEKLIDITGSNEIFDLYYVRYVVWYLLFSGKNVNKELFVKECEEKFSWLKKKRIKLRFPVFSKHLIGEKFSTKIIVNLFMIFYKLRAINLFAKLYCKG